MLAKARRESWIPGTGIMVSCKSPDEGLGTELRYSEVQEVLLTTEASPELSFQFFILYCSS